MEFCPLCKSRMIASALVSDPVLTGSELSNDELIIYDAHGDTAVSINIFDNKITSDIEDYFARKETNVEIMISRTCKKYHFYYEGTCKANFNKLKITHIKLYKSHFVRHRSNIHFVVNSFYDDDTTEVRLTVDYKTKTLNIPLVDFDFSSVKKINKKLRNIELLG